MSLNTITTALDDAGLLAKFRAAALKSAGYVLTEDVNTANHAARLRWAQRCLVSDGDPFLMASARNMLRYSLATNGTIQTAGTAATDSDVEYVVAVILGDGAVLSFVTATSGDSFA